VDSDVTAAAEAIGGSGDDVTPKDEEENYNGDDENFIVAKAFNMA
jgi:hypothetical protein